jgi:hypothetical protein
MQMLPTQFSLQNAVAAKSTSIESVAATRIAVVAAHGNVL